MSDLGADSTPGTKRCPWCAEEILAEAKKCKHCGELLTNEGPGPTVPASASGTRTAIGPGVIVAVVLVIIALVVGLVVVASGGGGQDGWPEDEREASERVCSQKSIQLGEDYETCVDEAYQEWQREQG